MWKRQPEGGSSGLGTSPCSTSRRRSSPGAGTTPYLAGEVLKLRTGINMLHIPFPGAGPATTAVLAGQVDLYTANIGSLMALIDAGKVRPIAVTSRERWPDLPNVPLSINYAKTDEARKLIPSLVHSVGPAARPYVLPPGTPKDRIATLQKAFMETMKDPELLADAKKAKLEINPLDGAELEKAVREVFNLDPKLIPRAKEILK